MYFEKGHDYESFPKLKDHHVNQRKIWEDEEKDDILK